MTNTKIIRELLKIPPSERVIDIAQDVHDNHQSRRSGKSLL